MKEFQTSRTCEQTLLIGFFARAAAILISIHFIGPDFNFGDSGLCLLLRGYRYIEVHYIEVLLRAFHCYFGWAKGYRSL